MQTLIAVARNACVIRYRLDHGWGWLRIALAATDAYLFAAILFLVVSVAFGRGGIDRYFLIALGIIGLRWTLSCLATADTLAPLTRLLARDVRAARLHALVYLVAPPTLVYLLSLAGFAVVTALVGSGENTLAGIAGYPLLFACHLLFNVAAVLLVDLAFRRDWLTSTVPVLVVATAFWFVSPVMYRFDDLAVAGQRLLTTWSPGSHIVAAYHNSFWFGQPVSLEVLPVAAAAAALVSAVLLLWPGRAGVRRAGRTMPPLDDPLTLLIDPEGSLDAGGPPGAPEADGWTAYGPLRDPPRGLTAQDWVRLSQALRVPDGRHDGVAFAGRVEAAADLGDLYGRSMTLYPEAAMDRLVCALALARAAGTGRVLLVRLFDSLPRDQVRARWRWLAGARGGATVAVISNRLLVPGDDAEGAFVLLRPDAPPHPGRIAGDLAQAYAGYLEAASHAGAAADQSAKSS